MARALHWTIPFRSMDDTAYTINIYDEDYVGDVVTLVGAANPFEIQVDDDEDITVPLRPSSGYIRIVHDSLTLLDTLMPKSIDSRRVELLKGEEKMWIGYIQQQSFEQDYIQEQREVEIPIYSVLGMWMNKKLNGTADGFKSLAELFYLIANDHYDEVVFPEDTEFSSFSEYPPLVGCNLDIFKDEVDIQDHYDYPDIYTTYYTGGTYEDVLTDLCHVLGIYLIEDGQRLYAKWIYNVNTQYWIFNTSDLTSITASNIGFKIKEIIDNSSVEVTACSKEQTETHTEAYGSISISGQGGDDSMTLIAMDDLKRMLGHTNYATSYDITSLRQERYTDDTDEFTFYRYDSNGNALTSLVSLLSIQVSARDRGGGQWCQYLSKTDEDKAYPVTSLGDEGFTGLILAKPANVSEALPAFKATTRKAVCLAVCYSGFVFKVSGKAFYSDNEYSDDMSSDFSAEECKLSMTIKVGDKWLSRLTDDDTSCTLSDSESILNCKIGDKGEIDWEFQISSSICWGVLEITLYTPTVHKRIRIEDLQASVEAVEEPVIPVTGDYKLKKDFKVSKKIGDSDNEMSFDLQFDTEFPTRVISGFGGLPHYTDQGIWNLIERIINYLGQTISEPRQVIEMDISEYLDPMKMITLNGTDYNVLSQSRNFRTCTTRVKMICLPHLTEPTDGTDDEDEDDEEEDTEEETTE